MPYYKAIFHLPGGSELKAEKGYVSDDFFAAIQKVTIEDIVDIHEGKFVLSTDMHEKLSIPDTYASYAIIGLNTTEGNEKNPEFLKELLAHLKTSNHARPIEMHYNYQIFVMEHVDETIDDD